MLYDFADFASPSVIPLLLGLPVVGSDCSMAHSREETLEKYSMSTVGICDCFILLETERKWSEGLK